MALIASCQRNTIITLKSEKNQISQNVDKYIKEMEEKDKILEKQSEIIEKIKSVDPSKNWKEYLKIWRSINEM